MLHGLKLLLLINDPISGHTRAGSKRHFHVDDVMDRLIRVILYLLVNVSVVNRASDVPNPANTDVNTVHFVNISDMCHIYILSTRCVCMRSG